MLCESLKIKYPKIPETFKENDMFKWNVSNMWITFYADDDGLAVSKKFGKEKVSINTTKVERLIEDEEGRTTICLLSGKKYKINMSTEDVFKKFNKPDAKVEPEWIE